MLTDAQFERLLEALHPSRPLRPSEYKVVKAPPQEIRTVTLGKYIFKLAPLKVSEVEELILTEGGTLRKQREMVRCSIRNAVGELSEAVDKAIDSIPFPDYKRLVDEALEVTGFPKAV